MLLTVDITLEGFCTGATDNPGIADCLRHSMYKLQWVTVGHGAWTQDFLLSNVYIVKTAVRNAWLILDTDIQRYPVS